jgi:hypothetical protein
MNQFDEDLVLSREPVRRYLVETRLPGTDGTWLRASSPHATRELAQATLGQLAASPTAHPQAVRRVGAEVVLRYAAVGETDGSALFSHLTAGWAGSVTATYSHADGQKYYTLPLHSPEVGPVILEISQADLNRLLDHLESAHYALDPQHTQEFPNG